MYEYLIAGTNLRNRRIAEIVEAASAEDAVQQFADGGFSDIVLHTDDLTAQTSGSSLSESAKFLSPLDLVKVSTFNRLEISLFLISRLYMKLWLLVVFFGGWLFYRMLLGKQFVWFDAVCWVFLILPIPLALFLVWKGGFSLMLKLGKAMTWRRWEEVFRLIPRMKYDRFCPERIPLTNALALAGTGRLEQALQNFEPFSDGGTIPVYYYWLMKAMIYEVARDFDKVLESLDRAEALAPDNSQILVNCALSHLIFRQNVQRATELINRVKNRVMSDSLKPLFLHLQGSLLVESGRPSEAIPLLEKAVKAYRLFQKGNSALEATVVIMEAYLAIAHGMAGDRAIARGYFLRCAPLLRTQNLELLRRCEDNVG